MEDTTNGGQKPCSFVVLDKLIEKNGRVDFPADFGDDSTRLKSTLNALRSGGWPEVDVQMARTAVLSHSLGTNLCLHLFKRPKDN